MEKNLSSQIELPAKNLLNETEIQTLNMQKTYPKVPLLQPLSRLLQGWNAPLVWKISLTSLLNLAAIAIVVVVVSLTLQNVLSEIDFLNQTSSDRIRLSEVQNNLVFAEQALQNSLWSNSLNQLDDYFFRVERVQKVVSATDFANFVSTASLKQKQTSFGGAQVETSVGSINDLLQNYNTLTMFLGNGQVDQARREWQNNVARRSGQVNSGIASLAQSVDLSLQKASDHISELVQQTTLWLIVGMLSLIVLNIFLGLLQHLTISKPLSLTKYKLAYLKDDGQTDKMRHFEQLQVSNRDEIGDLVSTLVTTLQSQHNQNQFLYDRTRQALDRLNKDLYQLNNCQLAISTARHDLKTPLSNIRNQAELLLITNEFDAATKKTLENIIGVSDKGYSLIHNILSQQLSGNALSGLTLTLTDVTKLVQEALYLVDLRGKNVQLVFPANIQILADYSLMEHVLLNLLSNAAKFAATRIVIGGAEITNSSLENSADNENNHVSELATSALNRTYELTIWNDGATILEENSERIFQVGAQTAEGRRAGGNGLGLFIAKHIVELHKGRLVVDTQHELVKQHGGTCFKISLPQPATNSTSSTDAE